MNNLYLFKRLGFNLRFWKLLHLSFSIWSIVHTGTFKQVKFARCHSPSYGRAAISLLVGGAAALRTARESLTDQFAPVYQAYIPDYTSLPEYIYQWPMVSVWFDWFTVVLCCYFRYQNGAYWATPLSYITAAMIGTGHADFAEELLAEAIADFKLRGIYIYSLQRLLSLHRLRPAVMEWRLTMIISL